MDEKNREKEIYRVTIIGSVVNFYYWLLNLLPEYGGRVVL